MVEGPPDSLPVPQSSDGRTSLRYYYFDEVRRHLQQIDLSLSGLANGEGKSQGLSKLKNAAQSIEDLAMIHGYEGVENIAEKIKSAAGRILQQQYTLDKDFISKVQIAAGAIHKVLEMEERIELQMNMEKLDEQVEIRQKKIKACTDRLGRKFDRLFARQLELPFRFLDDGDGKTRTSGRENGNEIDDLFDIRELDSIMTLAGSAGSEAKKSDDPERLPVTTVLSSPVNDPSHSQGRRQEATVVERQSLTSEDKRYLDTIEQAVYELQMVPLSVEAVQEIRQACDALQTSVKSSKDQNLILIIDSLKKLTYEKLLETEPVPEYILDLLDQSLKYLNNQLAGSRADEEVIQALSRNFEKVLKAELTQSKKPEAESTESVLPQVLNGKETNSPINKFGSYLKRFINKSDHPD
ncbi:MAG: hypothetical protein ACE5HO_03455 [bacterium]